MNTNNKSHDLSSLEAAIETISSLKSFNGTKSIDSKARVKEDLDQ
jgi:hypothetical protein